MDGPNAKPVNIGDVETRIVQELSQGRNGITDLARSVNADKSIVCFALNRLTNQGAVDDGTYEILTTYRD